jgi:hypothetical protein
MIIGFETRDAEDDQELMEALVRMDIKTFKDSGPVLRLEKNDLLQFLNPRTLLCAPENDKLYGGFSIRNADDAELLASVGKEGVREPLKVSRDGVVLSGHRRLMAALQQMLRTVPVLVEDVTYGDLDANQRIKLLREHNRQRTKTFDEHVAEELADVEPEKAHEELRAYRTRRREEPSAVTAITMGGRKTRAKIQTTQFLSAVERILYESTADWPMSVRAIHYQLLSNPPLTHDSKPSSQYRNEPAYARRLSSLVTRARIEGILPIEAVCDETRPVRTWKSWGNPGEFVCECQADFLKGYARDLMAGQVNHIEILVEKETQRRAVEEVAQEYTIPVTTGRGYCSLPPRAAIAERYRRSGKERLVLLILSDHDPDGVTIAESFARSMRDDFRINGLLAVRVALNPEQIERYRLPSSLEAKPGSATYRKFVRKHGTRAVELDAMPRRVLQDELRSAIEAVIDRDAYEAELKQEREDAVRLEAMRKAAVALLGDMAS